MRAWASATTIGFACMWCAAGAQAAPSLRVQAGTVLHVSAERGEGQVRLAGSLADDRGVGLADREVALRVRGDDGAYTEAKAVTDATGEFAAGVPFSAPTRLSWHASFSSEEFYEGSELAGSLDIAQAPVRLALRTLRGAHVDLDLPYVTTTVHAWSTAGAANLDVRISDELGRVLARGRTDGDGRFEAEVATEDLEPGMGELIAASDGDAARAAASQHLAVTRSIASSVTLTATTDDTQSRITLQGTAATARGPLSQEAVRLEIDGRHVATVLSDHQGLFATTLAEDPLQPAQAALVARAYLEPDVPWIRPSRTDPIALVRARGAARHATWFLAPVAASLLLAAWLVLRARAHSTPRVLQPSPGAGLRLGQATTRAAPTLTMISGHVNDAATGQPLTAAILHLDPVDGAGIEVPVSNTGAFQSAALPAGNYTLTARAPGYADVQAPIAIPHAGQGSAIAITLSSLRGLALASHRRVVDELIGSDATSARAAQSWTPRDGLERAAAAASDPASLAELTSLVENAAYAAATPAPNDLAHVDGRADALIAQERSRRGPAPRRRR